MPSWHTARACLVRNSSRRDERLPAFFGFAIREISLADVSMLMKQIPAPDQSAIDFFSELYALLSRHHALPISRSWEEMLDHAAYENGIDLRRIREENGAESAGHNP
jgi:hypothetical protein